VHVSCDPKAWNPWMEVGLNGSSDVHLRFECACAFECHQDRNEVSWTNTEAIERVYDFAQRGCGRNHMNVAPFFDDIDLAIGNNDGVSVREWIWLRNGGAFRNLNGERSVRDCGRTDAHTGSHDDGSRAFVDHDLCVL